MDDRLTNDGEIKQLDNPIFDEYDEYDEIIEFYDKVFTEYGIGIVSLVALNKLMKELTINVIESKKEGKEMKL